MEREVVEQNQVRSTSTNSERLAHDHQPGQSEQRASSSGEGGGPSVQPVDSPAFEHHCEVCDLKLLLTPEIAFNLGWDYPPRMGAWGIISPRTCGNCTIDGTAWWALVALKTPVEELSDKHLATVHRIIQERER